MEKSFAIGCTLFSMFIRTFSLATIVAQALLGSLCMMPMAMAADMEDMPAMHHDMGAGESSEDAEEVDCGSGHCFMHALPSPLPSIVSPDACPHAPAPIVFFTSSIADESPVPMSAAPPGNGIRLKTIVMRM